MEKLVIPSERTRGMVRVRACDSGDANPSHKKGGED